VIEFNESAAGERLAHAAHLLGGDRCADAVRALRGRLGIAAGLQAAGVPREKLDALADLAVKDACHTLNPRPCSRDDLRALYEASF
jgi:alcohol dehydrogenase class IV